MPTLRQKSGPKPGPNFRASWTHVAENRQMGRGVESVRVPVGCEGEVPRSDHSGVACRRGGPRWAAGRARPLQVWEQAARESALSGVGLHLDPEGQWCAELDSGAELEYQAIDTEFVVVPAAASSTASGVGLTLVSGRTKETSWSWKPVRTSSSSLLSLLYQNGRLWTTDGSSPIQHVSNNVRHRMFLTLLSPIFILK